MQEVLGRTESSATTVDDLERWAAELRGLNR
jgi:hypothetical protein